MAIITINQQDVQVKEYNGQRVVTFKEIDAVHGRKMGTAGRAFRKNKAHFIEGADYFSIKSPEFQPDEMRRLGIHSPFGGNLLTESGYLMLVKSFGDKLAWQVQRQLVNAYFHVKAAPVVQQAALPSGKPRQYHGQIVRTLKDIYRGAGLPPHTTGYYLRNDPQFKQAEDYVILSGTELIAFKRDNADLSSMISGLTVVTQAGLEKLANGYCVRIDPEKLAQLPSLPDNASQDSVKDDKRKFAEDQWEDAPAALRVIRRLYDFYQDEKYRYPLRNAAWMIACNMSLNLFDLGDIMTPGVVPDGPRLPV